VFPLRLRLHVGLRLRAVINEKEKPSHWWDIRLHAKPEGHLEDCWASVPRLSSSHWPVSGLTVIPGGQSTIWHSILAVFQTVPDGHCTTTGPSEGDKGNISGNSHWRSSTFQTLPFRQRRSSSLGDDGAEGVEAGDLQMKLPGVLRQLWCGLHECVPATHSSTSAIQHRHHRILWFYCFKFITVQPTLQRAAKLALQALLTLLRNNLRQVRRVGLLCLALLKLRSYS